MLARFLLFNAFSNAVCSFNALCFAVVVPVTSVVGTCSEATLAIRFSTLMVKCLMWILGRTSLG